MWASSAEGGEIQRYVTFMTIDNFSHFEIWVYLLRHAFGNDSVINNA